LRRCRAGAGACPARGSNACTQRWSLNAQALGCSGVCVCVCVCLSTCAPRNMCTASCA
jgi:hypothetical protein